MASPPEIKFGASTSFPPLIDTESGASTSPPSLEGMKSGASNSISLFYVYVLESLKDKYRYVGYTNDLRRRLEEHRKGLSLSTKPRLPMKLIYFEGSLNQEDAMRREAYFKSTRGRNSLAKRLETYYKSNL